MTNAGNPTATKADAVGKRGEPRPSRLRQILEEQPQARGRIGRAVAALLGTGLVALAALGALLIWHLIRRGRLIRERLSPPRKVGLPDADADAEENGKFDGHEPR
jgi:hypothetical protein